MHVCAYDEALGVPTEQAATLALRTQQVVGFETGVSELVDPLGGSYLLEQLTDDLEIQIFAEMASIADKGGALACIENGYFTSSLSDSAYSQALEVDRGERKVIGVNSYVTEPVSFEVFETDPASEGSQIASVRALRISRDNASVAVALAKLHEIAAAGGNVVPPCVEAVAVYATVGEIVDVLRKIHGQWSPTKNF
jgi:methylmalonyl-CoA mutase N-terminal domain/subunit